MRNKPVGEAQTTLNSQGWTKVAVTGGTVPTTDKAKDGLVALENPQPGIAYPQSTQITLSAYKYVPPTPTCTPSTPTSSGTPTGSGTSSSSAPSPSPSSRPTC